MVTSRRERYPVTVDHAADDVEVALIVRELRQRLRDFDVVLGRGFVQLGTLDDRRLRLLSERRRIGSDTLQLVAGEVVELLEGGHAVGETAALLLLQPNLHNAAVGGALADLHREVAQKTAQLESLSLHVVHTLAKAIDAKDAYTNGHSERVADYSREIARRYGYDEDRQEEIYMMGLLHDVGKIGVPDTVINKPGRLTDEEYAVIKKHPVMGAEILATVSEMPGLVTGARWHHERYDGSGYPDGLKGEEIPEEARIIAVADAYDAMTSHRSYRGIIPQDKVRSEIENGIGRQFDEKFARIMLEMIAEDKDYTMHE